VSGLGRFRVNVMRQRGSVGLVLRRVQSEIPSFDELGLPPAIKRLCDHQRGLILVTGPTGSGKTTTLGTMVDFINERYNKHIVTIEDPIEILHADKESIVNQREVGTDTADFNAALKRVLRQDPDVILVGEMRDVETVKTALTAAETGHLVFSTLHTISATDSINRIIDFFPPHEQRQVRMSLAASLRGIISQRLVEKRGGGRVPAVELLVATGRVFDKIVTPEETHEIETIIAEGEYYGMQTFDQSLLALYKQGQIELREALAASTTPHDLRLMIEQFTMEEAAQEQAAAG
jgi:twitching motility protein PilT